jgi:CheY-like chemotaxis protein
MHHVYLVAEDDKSAQLLLQRAFLKAGLHFPIHFTSDGQETIDYLRGVGRFANREQYPFPALLLLDFNMPKLNGLEVLKKIRADTDLKKLIVVMLSSSVAEPEIAEAYKAGVNSYVEKPHGFSELLHTLICINAYWFGCNHFPHAVNGIVRPDKRHRASANS